MFASSLEVNFVLHGSLLLYFVLISPQSACHEGNSAAPGHGEAGSGCKWLFARGYLTSVARPKSGTWVRNATDVVYRAEHSDTHNTSIVE